MARDLFEEAGISPAGGRDLFAELGVTPPGPPKTAKAASAAEFARQVGVGLPSVLVSGGGRAAQWLGDFIQAPLDTPKAMVHGLVAAVSDKEDDRYAGRLQAAQDAAKEAEASRQYNLDMGNAFAVAGKALHDSGKQGAEIATKYREQEAPIIAQQQRNNEAAKGVFPTLKSMVLDNPLGSIATVTESIPDIGIGALTGMGAGNIAAAVARKGVQATLADANAMLRSGLISPENAAQRVGAARAAAQKSAEGFAGEASILSEAASSAGSTGIGVRDFVEQQPHEKLTENSPRYRELVQSLGNRDAARSVLARELQSQAALPAGVATYLGGKLVGEPQAMGATLMRKGMTGKELVQRTGIEAAQEMAQNPGENYAQYRAQQQVDPTQTFDLGKSIAEGWVTGTGMGGAMHAPRYIDGKLTGKPASENVPPAVTPEAGNDPANQPAIAAPVVPPPAATQAATPSATQAQAAAQNPVPETVQEQATAQPAVSPEQQAKLSQAAIRLAEIELLRDSRALTPEESAEEAGLRSMLDSEIVATQQDEGNGTNPASGTHAEVAAPSNETGRTELPGGGGILETSPSVDPGNAGYRSEMAESGLRPAAASGIPSVEGVAQQPVSGAQQATQGVSNAIAGQPAPVVQQVADAELERRKSIAESANANMAQLQKSAGHMGFVPATVESPAVQEIVARQDGRIGVADVGKAIDGETGNRFTRALMSDTPANREKIMKEMGAQSAQPQAAPSGAPAGTSTVRAKQSPIMRRDDLVGAVMRVTGGNGIAAHMAETIIGEKANRAGGLRGLFSRQGVMDLDDTATHLRESEGYDVRDGNHLAELLRDQANGSPVYSMARQEQEATANAEKQYREQMRQKAGELGVKTVGRKFQDVESDVLEAEARQHQTEVDALDAKSLDAYHALVEEAKSLGIDADAVLADIPEGLSTSESYRIAADRLVPIIKAKLAEINARAQSAAYDEQINQEDSRNVESYGIDGRTDPGNAGKGNEAGRAETGAGRDARQGGEAQGGTKAEGRARQEGFALEQQTLADVRRQEADRVAAEKAAQEKQKKDDEAERKEKERAEVRRRAEFAASTFQLGQDGMDNLTGQGGLFESNSSGGSENKKADSASKGLESRRAPTSEDIDSQEWLDGHMEEITLEALSMSEEDIDEAEARFLSDAPEGATRYTRSTRLLAGIREKAKAIADELGGKAERRRTVGSRLGPFAGFQVTAKVQPTDDFGTPGALQVSIYGKEQIEQGITQAPALFITVSGDGELTITAPSPGSATFEEFRKRGWADIARGAKGEPLPGWSALQDPERPGKKLPFREIIPLLADLRARVGLWTGDDYIGLHYSRATGALGALSIPEGMSNDTFLYFSEANPSGEQASSPTVETRRRLSFIKATADKFSRQFKGASALDVRVVADRSEIPSRHRPSPYAEGVYHGDSGTIYLIAKNLPTAHRAWQVLMHEAVGHYGLANLMGENFASLQSLVMEKARASRVLESAPAVGDADYATIDAVRLLYPNASESEVAQEVLARMAETMPQTSWFRMLLARVRTWARSKAEAVGIQWNPTLQDARDMVTLAARHLQKGSNLSSREEQSGLVAASNRKDDPEFTETERAYGGREAYDREKSSGRTKLNYRQWVQVRTPAFKAWFGDWEISGSVPKRQASTFDEARLAAKTFQGNPLTNGATGIVATVSRNSLDKMLSGKAVGKSESPATHSLAVANLDALFERAMLGWSKPDSEGDPNIKAIHRFFTPVMADGRAMLAKMTVKETGLVGDPNPLYTVEAVSFDEMKSPAAQWVAEIAGADGIDPRTIRSAGLIESMAQRVQEFKPDSVSKVTDPETGEPLVVYHGTNADFSEFRKSYQHQGQYGGEGFFFTGKADAASLFGDAVMPVFLQAKTGLMEKRRAREIGKDIQVDHIRPKDDARDIWVVMSPTQIKSATGNNGAFDGSNPNILESRAIPSISEIAKRAEPHLENLVYNYQDKYIDLKNVQARIKEMGGTLTELNDAYLGEEMYHSRVMKKTHDFAERELKPLLTQLYNNRISKEDFEQYLHARHAPEANKALAERNPSRKIILETQERIEKEVKALEVQVAQAKKQGNTAQDLKDALAMKRQEAMAWENVEAFDGTEEERLSLSGMSDAEAAQVMSGIPAVRRWAYESAAKKVDAIVEGTRAEQERSGLTSKAEVDAWRAAYQHYVPLYRDEAHPDSVTHSIGQGFSVRGAATKRRTGSNEKVTNILGHIAMQRESTITRSEKNMVAKRLYLLAAQNPIKGFWQVGLVPKIKIITPNTGTVRSIDDPTYLGKPNVLAVRIAGKDTAVIFDERNPEAMRLAGALKNMDGQKLEGVVNLFAMGTRWFASVNTQYNPIFGIVNLTRDVQGALINLSSTEIAAQKKAVFAESMRLSKEVLKAKFDLDKLPAADRARWEEFQDTGGATGFRDLFANPEDRAKALEKEFKALGRGKTSQKLHRAAEILSDFNESMENVVRLSAYKIALDNGMSKARAASLAKNITVNFNRKGSKSQKLGAFFAFFNASVQGTARLSQALRSPAGKKIILGGMALGVLQQLAGMLLMGGGDDDQWEKIPDFVKERNLIIPISRTNFISIPMPLGYNVLPNIGRLFTEFALGGSDKPTGKQLVKLFDASVGAFNPLGGSGIVDTVTPTVADPAISLLRNQDWTRRPIYREDSKANDPTPGHTRTKDTATPWAKGLSKAINWATLGTDYRPGALSPTPDQIDYVIGQLTGGVGRELGKLSQTVSAPFSGDELPMHKIPLVGRFVGSTDGVAGQSEKFYENVKELNGIQREIKGRWQNGEDAESYIKSEPLSDLVGLGDAAELQIKTFRVLRKQLKKEEDTAGVKEVDLLISETMKDLNMAVRRARQ